MADLLSQAAFALGGLLLSAVGLWIAHSFRRQMRLKLTDQLYAAYAALWELTGRLPTFTNQLACSEQRRELSRAMGNWYYEGGHGLLMPASTRKLFFVIMQNLVVPANAVLPLGLRRRLLSLPDEQREAVLTCACIRFLSLLRSQLKEDMAIYGGLRRNRDRGSRLEDERELELACGIPVGRRATAARPSTTPCLCRTCGDHVVNSAIYIRPARQRRDISRGKDPTDPRGEHPVLDRQSRTPETW